MGQYYSMKNHAREEGGACKGGRGRGGVDHVHRP